MSYNGPRDYCKHGKYVGGCGIDWMCHPCEMGDPDITVNELRQDLADEMQALVDETLFLEEIAASVPSFYRSIPEVTRTRRCNIASARRTLVEAQHWSKHDDDDAWLSTRHYAEIDEDDKRMAESEAERAA